MLKEVQEEAHALLKHRDQSLYVLVHVKALFLLLSMQGSYSDAYISSL